MSSEQLGESVDWRWLGIVLLVTGIAGGIIGGLAEYAVSQAIGYSPVLLTLDVGSAIAFLVMSAGLGYLAGDDVQEVISRHG